MGLPGDLGTAVLTGKFLDSAGNPMRGTVTIVPNSTLTDATGNVIVPQLPRHYQLFGGAFTTPPLVATDNSDINPPGWTYVIQVALQDVPTYTFNIALPTSGSPVNLATLSPAQSIPQMAGYLAVTGGTVTGKVTLTGATPLQITAGAAAGDVLTSDASGNASWEPVSASLPAATSSSQGAIELNTDLGGTATAPHVVATHLAAALPLAQGGTGQTTAQAAMDALAGGTSSGTYLRGSGSHAVMSAIQAADVPALNYVPLAPLPSGDTSGATDAAALQAYLNALPAGSDVQLNSTAPYYINAALTVSKALTFRGGAVINQVTSNTAGVVVTAGGFTWDGPTLNGPQYTAFHSSESAIKVTGASASSYISYIRIRRSVFSSWGAEAISVQYASDVTIHDNDISNIQYAGVLFQSVTGGEISGNRIDSIVGSASNSGDCYGISLSEAATGVGTIDPVSQNIVVTGNRVTNVSIWTGIDTHAGTNITISGNIVQGCNYGIATVSQHDTGGTPVTGPHRVKITGNVVDIGALGAGQGTYGIVVQGAIVTTGTPVDAATGCSVTGNEVYGYGQPYESSVTLGGITAICTNGLSVSGNTLENCGPAGICLYHDNYSFAIGPNTFTDCWDLHGHAGAIWLSSGYNTGTASLGSVYAPGTVQAQAVIAAASVGANVSSVTTLTLQGTVNNTSPSQVFAASGSVTVPTSTGTATLAYTGTTSTTLTGVTLSAGSGTITAGFAGQTPANLSLYGIFSNASTNSTLLYRGHNEAATEISDSFASVFVPNFPKVYAAQASIYTVTVPWGAAWLDTELTGGGAGGTGGGAAALTGGVSTQVGGGGGGAGAYIRRGFAITSAMWGGTLSVTSPPSVAGGTGGAASSGSTGNAGNAGTAGTTASVTGSGSTSAISITAQGGGVGIAPAANSTASVAGGTYARAGNPLTTVTAPGQGGVATSTTGGSGAVGIGTSGAGGSGGGPATATNGGGAGQPGGPGAPGSVGASGTSGTANGVSASSSSIPGAGGGGGGGGAPGGSGGNGGAGGPGQVVLTWR